MSLQKGYQNYDSYIKHYSNRAPAYYRSVHCDISDHSTYTPVCTTYYSGGGVAVAFRYYGLNIMTMSEDQFKLAVKLFVKQHNYSYSDVASVAEVSESTVRNWMAKKKIPAVKKKLLEVWMSSKKNADSLPVTPAAVVEDSRITRARLLIGVLAEAEKQWPELKGDYNAIVCRIFRDAAIAAL